MKSKATLAQLPRMLSGPYWRGLHWLHSFTFNKIGSYSIPFFAPPHLDHHLNKTLSLSLSSHSPLSHSSSSPLLLLPNTPSSFSPVLLSLSTSSKQSIQSHSPTTTPTQDPPTSSHSPAMAPTKRRFQDPIAPQSSSLCYYMNNHPAVVLSFARYFGEYLDAESAKMIEVDHAGFLVTCQLKDGQEHEIRVAFDHPVHEVNQCKEMIMKLAKEAETALRGPDQTQQGAMPDSTFYWPDFDQGLFVVLFLLTLAYLEFVPYTKSPQLKWIIDTVGSTLIHQVSVLVFSIHFFEAIATLYFTLVVGGGTDFFTPTDIGMWMVTTLVFGVASLTKLVPLAYRAQAKAQQKRKE